DIFDAGGGQGPIPPVPPVPPVPPQPQKDFTPPPEARQPTLRVHDKSPDGWVEYLQKRLNETVKAGLTIDSDFGSKTRNAVIEFENRNKLKKVDGIVGNETWSALREGPREEPSTDGRVPHTYREKGPEGRWNREKQDAIYKTAADLLVMHIVSVGDSP